MDFAEYWDKLAQANPSIKVGNCSITMSIHSFKKELAKAFDAGRKPTYNTDGLDFLNNFLNPSKN